jgi:outer membrane protein TolC
MPSAVSKLTTFALPVALLLGARVAWAETIKLEDLEQLALKNRGSVTAARARVNGAEARIALAKVPYYPTLAAKADVIATPGGRVVQACDYRDQRPDGSCSKPLYVSGSRAFGQPGAYEPVAHYDAALSLQTRIYDFGRTAASVRAARAERDASLAGVRAEQSAVAVEVRGAYLSWLSATETRAILAESARDAAALRASVEAHIAEGSRPGAELASARYDEARAALDLERSETDLGIALLDLEQVAGGPLPKSAAPDMTLLDRSPPAASVMSHPEVQALERRRDAAAASGEAHGYPYAPILAAGVDAGVHGLASTPFPLYQAELSVTMPLLDGGLESASAAVASSQATELSAQARDARSRVKLAQDRARLAFERSERRLALARTLVAAAEESVKHASDQHELGAGSLDAVTQAKLQASRARLEVLGARLERARAVLDLTAPTLK